jgi:hypothetical protein
MGAATGYTPSYNSSNLGDGTQAKELGVRNTFGTLLSIKVFQLQL